jgi:hypothetical protein
MRCDAMRCDAMRCDSIRCDTDTHLFVSCSLLPHVCVGSWGWYYASMAIVDPFTKNIVPYAYDSYSTHFYTTQDQTTTRKFCLPEGFYTFRVSSSPNSYTSVRNGWSLCGMSGTGPYEGPFKVQYDSSTDSWSCRRVSNAEVPTPDPTSAPTRPPTPTFAPTTAPSHRPTQSPTAAIAFAFDVNQVLA